MTPTLTWPVESANPWTGGRLGRRGGATLLFGRMYEDSTVELEALGGCRAILAVASAGDTAIALAGAGNEVTAVDINPVQVAYLGRRLAGGPAEIGQADRILAAGRQLLRPAGWTRDRLERLCALLDCQAQVAAWRRLTSGASGAALKAALAPSALRFGYQSTFARAAVGLGAVLPGRIDAALAIHPCRTNPWAHLLFTGAWPEPDFDPDRVRERIELVTGDVATHLEAVEPGRYDGFSLSNVLDGAPAGYRRRLVAALQSKAKPGAPVVLRTLGPPLSPADARAAQRDRALIWGGITICGVEALA